MSTPQQPSQPPRRRVEYTADFEHKLDRLLEKQTHLEISLGEIRASMMPRAEIDMEVEKRVSISSYLSDKTAIENRIKNLEDAPSSAWARAGILVSGGIGCLGLLVGSASILVSILIAVHAI